MSKISELSDGGSLVSTDFLIAVRSGGNVKVKMDTINVDQVDLGDNEFIRLGNSQDLTLVHNASNSIINQAGIGNLLIQKAGTTKASITANGLEFPDNSKAIFGDGSDLQIYHDGSNSYVRDAGTGELRLNSDNAVRIRKHDNETLALFSNDGSVQLYYDNAQKLATSSSGISVTGDIVLGDSNPTITMNDSSVTNLQHLITSSSDNLIIAADNNDVDAGTEIQFYVDGVERMATTATGIDVSGTALSHEVEIGDGSAGGTSEILFSDNVSARGKIVYDHSSSPETLLLQTTGSTGISIDNAQNVSIPNGDLDVTGTATMDGLTVSSDSGGPVYLQDSNATATYNISELSNNAGNFNVQTRDSSGVFVSTDYQIIKNASGADYHRWFTQGTERLRLDASGRLGIGENNPSNKLHVTQNVDALLAIEVDNQNTGASSAVALYLNGQGNNFYLKNYGDGTSNANITEFVSTASGSQFVFATASQEAMRISSGNLMVGVTSTTLTGGSLTLPNSGIIAFHDAGGNARNVLQFVSGDIKHGAAGGGVTTQSFYTSNTLAATIDSSQNVLVGTTSQISSGKLSVAGGASANGITATTSATAGYAAASFQRTASDGDLISFKQGATTVGLIGTDSNRLTIGTDDTGLIFSSLNYIRPWNPTANTGVDAAINLGGSSDRFKDLYLSGNVEMIHSSSGSIQMKRYDTTININNNLGQIVFGGSEDGGTTVNNSASIVALSSQNHTSTASGGYLTFNTTADNTTTLTERARIEASGNLLVGTTDSTPSTGGFSFLTGAVDYALFSHDSAVASGNYYIGFRHGTNTIGAITQSGTTGVSYNTSSDQRLKENIADADDAGSKIDAIQVRKFDWKADGSHQDYGMVAQELQVVAPEAVSAPEDPEDMMGVDYSKLVPMMLKEIQSLRARVAQLES